MRLLKLFVTFIGLAWMVNSRSFAAVPVVMASGVLQKCLGIEPGSGKMTRTAATRQYCRQFPANDIYNQAGARFQAGDHAGAAKIVLRAAEAGNAVAQLLPGAALRSGRRRAPERQERLRVVQPRRSTR